MPHCHSACRAVTVLDAAAHVAGASAPMAAMASPARTSSARSAMPRMCTKLPGSTRPAMPSGWGGQVPHEKSCRVSPVGRAMMVGR